MDLTTFALLVQSIAILITLLFTIYTIRKQLKADEIKIFLNLMDRYNAIAQIRAGFPDVQHLGRNWTPGNIDQIYENSEESLKLARYYSYAELCIDFCGTCIYLYNVEKQIPKAMYKGTFEKLVHLLVIENESIFIQLATRPFTANHFNRFMNEWQSIKKRKGYTTLPKYQ